ncbi:MAG: glycoside hydrolase [Luteitalea sp.]|nr:glycoside hydrolase [Luteitalea sp.]
MRRHVTLLAGSLLGMLSLVSVPAMQVASQDVVSLAGTWRFELDRDDRGILEHWYRRSLSQQIALPGVLQAQGFGDDVTPATEWTGQVVDRSYFTAPEYEPYRRPGNIKIPFWLQPDKHYVGPAWYQRDIEIPEPWRGQQVVLTLERPHWQTLVWIDDRIIGSNDSLSTPHVYDLGRTLEPGKHRLTVRVDNRLIVDVGVNSHSVSDHTQSNWNGVAGRIELAATPAVWIDDLQLYPDVDAKLVLVRGKVGNATGRAGRGSVRLEAEGFNVAAPIAAPAPMNVDVQWNRHGGTFEARYSLGRGAKLWDEFTPVLYRLTATLEPGTAASAPLDARAPNLEARPFPFAVTFGLRQIGVEGTQFVVNGRKTFFRGTLESAIFPKTGHPPTDKGSWKRIISTAKAHGLNMFRFHSWCPPAAAFEAADELGFYLQVEAGSWANQSTRLGVGLPVDAWIYKETDRILRAYGNHPSFVLMAYGNEPEGNDEAYLARWLTHYKAKDQRRLYTAASGWPQIPENEFHVTPDPRIQAWGAGLKSRVNARPPETRTDYRDYIRKWRVPVISHEIGQWCAFPNFAEMPKYTGYLKPRNFEIFRERLDEQQMGGQARELLLASGKLQTLLYKEDIESALRTPGMGGFQLLDLHDFPGQGTALVGVLDAFWEPKGYVTAEEYRRFCNRTVPLARLERRVFSNSDTLEAVLEVAHFGPAPLADVSITWKLVPTEGGDQPVAGGSLPPRTIPLGNAIALGRVAADLRQVPAPQRYKLVVALEGTPFENDWDVWVYPDRVDTRTPQAVTIATDLDRATLTTLRDGGRVLLMIPPKRVKGDDRRSAKRGGGPVALGFSSIFWNTAWTGGQPPHTLGILCDPEHPALAAFPTDYHSNWQWWYLVTRAGAMLLDDLPSQLRPTVQVIDDWVTSRKLGLIFEAQVAGGRLLVTSIDLRKEGDRNLVARQMLHSLLTYMASNRFRPDVEITPEQVKGLIADP